MRNKKAILLLGAALILGGGATANAGSLSPTLLERAKRGDQSTVGVIVRFKFANDARGRSLFRNARAQLQNRINQLGPAAGFVTQALNSGRGTQLWLDQSVFLPLTPVQARVLAALPFVDTIFENFRVQVPRAVALSNASAPSGTPGISRISGRPRRGRRASGARTCASGTSTPGSTRATPSCRASSPPSPSSTRAATE